MYKSPPKPLFCMFTSSRCQGTSCLSAAGLCSLPGELCVLSSETTCEILTSHVLGWKGAWMLARLLGYSLKTSCPESGATGLLHEPSESWMFSIGL